MNGVLPPDTNGDVGPNHYVQWVNLSFAIYDKSGTRLYGPAAGNTLWSGFGGPCQTTNDGDPIVQYDPLADRWLMSQFAGVRTAGPFYQCIAVSQTGDPTGAWYRYVFLISNTKLNDYPHFGVWPDAYYMTINQFNAGSFSWGGQGVVAFEREKMLAGQAARMVYFDLFSVNPDFGAMLPSDLDGASPPPAGSPNYFIEVDDNVWGWPTDRLQIFQFHVDWNNLAASSFTGPTVLDTAPFDSNLCGYSRSCIPQQGTSQKVDAISDRLMYRLAYRNFGDHESLVVNHTVDVDGADHAGIRWYEIRSPGSTPTIYQQGTYAPDAAHRWMGSTAMDGSGNIALGFSVSSSTLFPSIRYAGRLAGDPLGTLAQGETTLMAGNGSQTHSAARWGDYSMLAVDPTDDCTFWFTSEYYSATSSAGWQTRIGSFKFPSCGVPYDLIMTAVSGPTSVAAGSSITMSDTALNAGTSDVGAFSVGLYLSTDGTITTSDLFLGSRLVNGLVSRESSSGSTTVTISSGVAAGTYYLGAIADYDDTILEDIETDNAHVGNAIAIASGADLVISAVSGPSSGGKASSITISDTVCNQGTGSARGGVVGFYLSDDTTITSSDTFLGSRDVNILASGSCSSGSTPVTIPPSVVMGHQYYIGAIADDTSIIPENSETNNALAGNTLTIEAPDLIMTAVSPNAGSANPGSTLSVTDTAKNQGVVGSGSFTVAYRLSLNAIYGDGDDVAISTIRTATSLAAGASDTATTSLSIPASISLGNYYVCAMADSGNTNEEANEGNNTLCTASTIRVNRPDLAMTAITPNASLVSAGATLSVTDTVTNQGVNPTSASFTVAYSLSINAIYGDGDDVVITTTRTVSALAEGASDTATISLAIPSTTLPGTYYVCSKADSGNTTTETNEGNNTLCSTSLIQIRGPDLVMTAVAPNASLVSAGATLSVTDTVTNQGTNPTSAFFRVAYHLSLNTIYGDGDDVVFATTRLVTSLAAGASDTGGSSLTLPATMLPGSYYVCAMADSANTNPETNETNNTLCSSSQVSVPPSDLILTALSKSTTTTSPNWGLSYTATVKNQGGGGAVASVIGFRLSGNTVYGDGDDIVIPFTGGNVGALGAGASSADSSTLTVPATTPQGVYYLCAMADSGLAVSESDEGNNTLCMTSTVQVTWPDLVMTAVTPNASSVNAGAALSVTNTVKDQGVGNAYTFLVTYHLSFNAIYGDGDDVVITTTRTVQPMVAGATDTATTSLTLPVSAPPGSYYVCTMADSVNSQVETDETNNTLCSTFPIQVIGPDLIMTAVSPNASAVNPGATLSVSNTAKNQGTATAGSSVVAFHLSPNATYGDGDDVAITTTRTITSLTAGGTSATTTTVTVPSTTLPGSYYVCAMADSTNTNAEADETNNTLCSISTIQVLGPDLVMTAVTPAASTVNAGATLSVANTAMNQGAATAGSSVVAFRLSPNATYGDGDDLVLTATRTITSLTAGNTSTATTTVTIPSTTPAGSYYVCAKADANSTVAENDETNNTLCSATTISVPLPDLLVTVLSTTATTVNAGASVAVSNTIKNQGGTPAGSSVVAFHLSPNAIYGDGDDVVATTTRTIASLAIGATSAATTTVTVPSTTPAGTYYVCAKADANTTVTEGDETNNSLCTLTTVTVPLPDLLVTILSTTATTASAGGTVSLSNTVKNQGGTPTGSSVVAFHLSVNATYGDGDDLVLTTTRTIASLAVGATSAATTTVTLPSTTPTGTYYLCALADSGLTVTESDETNNSLCTATTVTVPLPDLTVSALSTTATTVTPGAAVSVSNTVTNAGGTPAGASVVAFHLSVNTTYGDGDDLILTATRTVTALAAGATSVATTTVTIPTSTPAGTYYVCAAADATTTVTEGDETNNTRCTTTTLTNSLDFPDLTVAALSTTATTITPGGSVSVTNTVTNPGATTAGSSVVAFHLSANTIYGDGDDLLSTTTRTIAALAAGATDTATTSVVVPSTAPPGAYYLCAKTDDTATVPESNETNNTRCTATTVSLAGPDLLVSALSTTATTVTPGASVALANTVTNSGGTAAGSSVVAFRLSPNTTYGDGDDLILTATRTIASLAVGATSTATTTVVIPTTAPPGTYYLCAKADANSTVAEGDETNNSLCTTTTVSIPGPDLLVTAVSTTATTVNAGATLSLSNSVKNQGGTPAGSSVVAFHLSLNATYGDGDDVVITTTRTISSLAVGATNTATTTVTVPTTTPAGSYYLCAIADANSTVAEGDETNNSLCTATTVSVPLPDLIVIALSTTTTTVNTGATLPVANTIKNQGGTAAGSSVVAFRLSPNATYGDGDDVVITTTRTLTSLGIGATNGVTTTVTVPTTIPAGIYYLCAMADATSTVAEGDETNNSLCTATTLTVPLPDLIVTVLSTTATTVNAGATISVSNTVKNQGGTAAGSSVVAFRLSPNTTYGDGDDVVLTTTRTITSLAVGATSGATTTVTTPSTTPPGSYYLCAKADANATVAEGDETNNPLCTATTVTVLGPDLIVSAVSTTATTVARGASLSLSNSVKNQGVTTAGASVVAFRLSTNTTYGDGDDLVLTATRTITSVTAGATSTATTSVTIPTTAPSGPYYLCAAADANSTVAENDETNNPLCTAGTITVP